MSRMISDRRLGRASAMTQHSHYASGCVGSRVRRALASPCVEGAPSTRRGGRTERHGLSSPMTTLNPGADRRAKSDGVPRWGCLSRVRPVTPTRCVQRGGPAVVCAVMAAMADPSRGRIALPPLRIEGIAFDTGGGDSASRLDVNCRLGRTSAMTPHLHNASDCGGSRMRPALASPCVEGSCLRHKEGGGRNATGLARPSRRSTQLPTGELSPMAFLGGGVLSRVRPVTPTRCVQRLSPAVECAVMSAMAGLSRGRIALPPRHDEGNAFDTGGGDSRFASRLKAVRRLGRASAMTQHSRRASSCVGSALRSTQPTRATSGSALRP